MPTISDKDTTDNTVHKLWLYSVNVSMWWPFSWTTRGGVCGCREIGPMSRLRVGWGGGVQDLWQCTTWGIGGSVTSREVLWSALYCVNAVYEDALDSYVFIREMNDWFHFSPVKLNGLYLLHDFYSMSWITFSILTNRKIFAHLSFSRPMCFPTENLLGLEAGSRKCVTYTFKESDFVKVW